MSIICTAYTSDSIIMAADSRATLNMSFQNKEDASKNFTHIFPFSDNVEKVFLLRKVQVGISVAGVMGRSGNKSMAQILREFEKKSLREGDSIFDVADKLYNMTNKEGEALPVCHVAGYDGDEPFCFSVSKEGSKRMNSKDAKLQQGITWSGEVAILQKLIMTDPKPTLDFRTISTKDAIEFTEFLIETAIKMQRFDMKPKPCGGPIDILILKPEGAMWYKHKLYDRTFIEMPKAQRLGVYIADSESNTIN